MYKLTIVILTYNEEIHIARAINNVLSWADKIIVLDSYSQDKTVEIAANLGAEVVFRKFDDYRNQRLHAIDYCKDKTEWMLFLDADEYLLDKAKDEIIAVVHQKNNIAGYYLPRRFIFMKKWIRYGGYYPCYLMRLFEPKKATIYGAVNEHILIDGEVAKLKYDVVDHNLKDVAAWVNKHNKYTDLEALRLWQSKSTKEKSGFFASFMKLEWKDWVRENIWNHLPLLIKPFFYFFYRYFIRLGFLDGKVGFIYHLLQGWWYYFMIDVKYIEIKMHAANLSRQSIEDEKLLAKSD
jgi:glycosyltransferase involved in cell wall biosynthesis